MSRAQAYEQTALVTGGSGGIGSAICRRLAANGASVVVHYHRAEKSATELVAELGESGCRAAAVQADLGDADGARSLIARSADELGPLNVLVNNAAAQPVAEFAAISSGDMDDMLAMNVGGPFRLIQLFAEQVPPTARASVVNIASIEGLRPARDHSHYAISKAALLMLTRAAALELGPRGVRVNSVSPGLIDRDGLETDWPEGVARWRRSAPLGELGSPQDVANAVAFLVSDEARFVNAHNLVVDGGMQANPGW